MKSICIGVGIAALLNIASAGAQSSSVQTTTRIQTDRSQIEERVLGRVEPSTTGSATGSVVYARGSCRELTVHSPQSGSSQVVRKIYRCD